MRVQLISGIFLVLFSCSSESTDTRQEEVMETKNIDWQGHRGARGLMPENTVAGFLKALEFPVTTLELDVVISKDGKVIVSHEPWFSSEICSVDNGDSIRIYDLTADEIATIDCGSKIHQRFPQQQKLFTSKPVLEEVVHAVASYCEENNRPLPNFNIELKSMPEWYTIFVPEPPIFTAIVLSEIDRLEISERTTIQSFDPDILNEAFKTKSLVKTAFLVENSKDKTNLFPVLSQQPDIYSPHYSLLNKQEVKEMQRKGMKVIPWTVNDLPTIRALITMHVDGIITDYPNLITKVVHP